MTGDPEAAAEIVPECDAELAAGLGKSEERIATIAATVAACSGADLAAGNLAGSGANRLRDRAGRFVRPARFALSCRQHCIPDGRRTSTLETQPAEIELSLVDSAQQFNAGNRDRCGLKPLKSQHWTDA